MNEQKQQKLPKKEFAKLMSERRNFLFNMANEQVEKAVESGDSFLTYLNIKSQFDYTVTNTLLVMAQNPKATMLKDIAHWRDNNQYIKKGEKGIQIFEPIEYTRRDGQPGISYNPKYVFDISQLQGKDNHFSPPDYRTEEIVSALIYKTDIQPKIADENTKTHERVFYDPGSQTIFVMEGLDEKSMINGLLREYCLAEFIEQGYTRDEAIFNAECSAYMLSKRYGIGEYNTLFLSSCTEHFFSMDPKEIKVELENISSVSDSISSRMKNGLYAQQEQSRQKEKNVGEHER